MIEKIIDYSARNKFVVIVAYLVIIGWGIWAVATTPLDAIPDLSENQVIVFTEWMGRAPQLVEDQITFPLVTALQGVPEVEAIRAQSMFGMSFIYIIFNETTDLYWARSRVLEKLSTVQSALPAGAIAARSRRDRRGTRVLVHGRGQTRPWHAARHPGLVRQA